MDLIFKENDNHLNLFKYIFILDLCLINGISILFHYYIIHFLASLSLYIMIMKKLLHYLL